MDFSQAKKKGIFDSRQFTYILDSVLSNESLRAKLFLKQFFTTYSTLDGEKKYLARLKDIANLETTVLVIELSEVIDFGEKDSVVSNLVFKNARMFVNLCYEVVDELMPEPVSLSALEEIDNETRISEHVRISEQLMRERIIRIAESKRNAERAETAGEAVATETPLVPRSLLRRYSLEIVPSEAMEVSPLRLVGAPQYGGMVKVCGIVTKLGTVKLQLVVAAYICDHCGTEIYQEVSKSSKQFNPVVLCPTPICVNSKVRRLPLVMNNRRSKFRKYQDITIQELSEHVPTGHVPYSIRVECTDSCTNACKGGDTISVLGIFLGEKLKTFEGRAQNLRLPYIRALHLNIHSRSYEDIGSTLDFETESIIDKLSLDPDIYEKLAKALAPEICGLIDAKKALLLQLVSGNSRNLEDGLKIRTDINICLVGDPGVAKSQLLKAVARTSPRAIYTSGKGSSAVGLTAAIAQDRYSGEIILEPGALVLADLGICCIDEFDKMSEADRTSIHEIMEQQTASIAKAGVTTTLKARTAILAASNPVLGRYNMKMTPAENMGLPTALLSRFDLIFILLDRPDEHRDLELAEHIIGPHLVENKENKAGEDFGKATFATVKQNLDEGNRIPLNILQAYLSQAKQVEPSIPNDVVNIIVEEYVAMRQSDKAHADRARKREQLTPRQLLSLLRLSYSRAKLRMDSQVTREDVSEAIRLIRASKMGLELNEKHSASAKINEEKLYHVIQSYIDDKIRRENIVTSNGVALNWAEIEKHCFSHGATSILIQRTIKTYEQLQLWKLDHDNGVLLII